MNFFKRYLAYLEDNPNRYWFKRKAYGWGWTPARWQGWLTLGIFTVLVVSDFSRVDAVQHSGSDTLLNVAPHFIAFVLLLISFCYLTGESPRWQWGIPDTHDHA